MQQHSIKVILRPIWQGREIQPLLQATPGSAAYDIRAAETLDINPGVTYKISTGVRLEMPDDMYMLIYSRSGLSSLGVVVASGVGVIDSDYRGEVFVLLTNRDCIPFTISFGDRIAQAVFKKKDPINLDFINEVDYIMAKTTRGSGGFGSTGVK